MKFSYNPKSKLIKTLKESQGIFNVLIGQRGIEKNIQEIISDTDELIKILQNKTLSEFKDIFQINKGIDWHIIYSKFSKVLYEFYKKFGDKSGEKLFKKYQKKDNNYEILPWAKHFKEYNVSSLDPIHIFASFTYWNISLETRKKKMIFFCELLKSFEIETDDLETDIEKSISSNYQYFPHPNITYIVSARNHKTQKEVWKFFSLIYNNQKNDKLEEIFNIINNTWYGVKVESATIFAFWINSSNFLPLDKNTLNLLKKYDKLKNIPSSYNEYKLLLNNEDVSLYRSLSKIANNESLKSSLTDEEKEELNRFFQKTSTVNIDGDIKGIVNVEDNTSNISIDISSENKLEKIKDFDFELYFIVSGKAKKIVYREGKIKSINKLEVIHNEENIVYQNFQIIAIKALNNNYTMVLKPNTFYYFNKNFEIFDNNKLKINHNNNIDLYTGIGVNINITAILGKNGTGKSTLVDLLLMALYNITCSLSPKDKEIYSLEELFYTIHSNYSIYSLNTKDYEGDWLNNLFHKRDNYQIPIVIEPHRKDGNIDINVLNEVSKQRLLSTILEPNETIDSKKLLEAKNATHLNISINFKKICRIINFMNPQLNIEYSKKLEESELLNYIQKILDDTKNRNIINVINKKVSDERNEYIKYRDENIEDSSIINNVIRETFTENKYLLYAKIYICYKLKSIADTYFKEYNEKYHTLEFINIVLKDKTYKSFKLYQVLNYIKFDTLVKVGKGLVIDELSHKIKDIFGVKERINKKFNKEEFFSTIEFMPPAFYEVDIMINEKISFNTLSSGEKQKIYSISSILYHLQNINSVHRSNQRNIIKYSHVNLILDEIELYFHPDMQRTYIYDLLEAIENTGGLNHINALNIIMVTHSPFILSDIVESNIMYLGRKDNDIEKTFGANIHTLLDNSFFMEDGLMGKFAKEKINTVIDFLKTDDSLVSKHVIQKVINSIGEPFLKEKLQQMYNDKYPITDEERIKALKEQIKRIENGKNKF